MRRVLLVVLAVAVAGCAAPPGTPAPQAPADPAAPTIAPEEPAPIAANPFRDREADAAIDPRDPLHVAVFYNERPSPYLTGAIVTDPITPGLIRQALAVSHDGGATWARSVLPHAGSAAPGSAWAAFCAMGDPNVLFDDDSVIHVVTLFIECGGPLLGSANGILHATTADDGATWSEPDLAWVSAGGLTVLFHDREWTAHDPASGRLGIAWTALVAAGNRAELSVIFSDDGGLTWSRPEVLLAMGPVDPSINFLVHAVWGGDGAFHVTTYGCMEGAPLARTTGQCLWHFYGPPGGPWQQSGAPLTVCSGAPEGAVVDYATSAADRTRGRLYAATPVLVQGAVAGVCVFGSPNDGFAWFGGPFLAGADHPWLALAPDGRPALAYLAMDNGTATPTLALLDPETLAVQERAALGPAYDADTDDDGAPEYGDYDALAASGGRFVWALTLPNQEGRPSADNEPWNDLDVWAYRGAFRGAFKYMDASMHGYMADRHVQATLPEPLYDSLWRTAKRQKRSIKAVVREAVEQYVRQASPAEDDPLTGFVGSGKLRETTWSERKDWRA